MGKYLIHYKERSIKDLTPFLFLFFSFSQMKDCTIMLSTSQNVTVCFILEKSFILKFHSEQSTLGSSLMMICLLLHRKTK